MSTDDEIDALYRLPLDSFVEARNALAARLKANGDKDGATAVKALSRPSVAAWALNQIYWTERMAFDTLIDASARLHAAQAAGETGTPLREATKARRDATGTLLKKAESILAAGGHGNTAAVQQRLSNTLLALSGPGAAGPDARPGRLARDLDPPGFEALSGVAAFPPRARETKPEGLALVPPPKAVGRPDAASSDDVDQTQKADETEDALQKAKEVLAIAERALDRARNEARVADGELTIAKNRAEGARSELEEATRRLDRARERASVTEADEAAANDKVKRAAEAREKAEAERDAALRAVRSLE